MNKLPNGVLLILLIIYVVSPIDFFPGPIDDIILTLLSAGGYVLKSKNDD